MVHSSEMSFKAFEQAGTNTCSLAPHTVGDAQNIYIDLQCFAEFETVDMDASPALRDASPAQFQGMLSQLQEMLTQLQKMLVQPSFRAC